MQGNAIDPAELYRRGCELMDRKDRHIQDEDAPAHHERHMRNAAYAQALFTGALAGAAMAGAADGLGVDNPDLERRWFAALGLSEGSEA